MAKLVIRDLTDIRFATVKAVFDEIAEDCSLLSVSDDGNYKLILTVDTDLVISMQLAGGTATFSSRSVVFNGNTLNSSTSSVTWGSIRIVIAYTDTFFFVWIKQFSGNSNILYSFYEKLGNEKFAYGYVSSSSTSVTTVYDMDNKTYYRAAITNYSYSLPINYIDYMDSTILVGSSGGYRASEFDNNFLYIISQVSGLTYNIVTIDNKDYYALNNQYLIPIDPE